MRWDDMSCSLSSCCRHHLSSSPSFSFASAFIIVSHDCLFTHAQKDLSLISEVLWCPYISFLVIMHVKTNKQDMLNKHSTVLILFLFYKYYSFISEVLTYSKNIKLETLSNLLTTSMQKSTEKEKIHQ